MNKFYFMMAFLSVSMVAKSQVYCEEHFEGDDSKYWYSADSLIYETGFIGKEKALKTISWLDGIKTEYVHKVIKVEEGANGTIYTIKYNQGDLETIYFHSDKVEVFRNGKLGAFTLKGKINYKQVN
jgi:hypothetical protein